MGRPLRGRSAVRSNCSLKVNRGHRIKDHGLAVLPLAVFLSGQRRLPYRQGVVPRHGAKRLLRFSLAGLTRLSHSPTAR